MTNNPYRTLFAIVCSTLLWLTAATAQDTDYYSAAKDDGTTIDSPQPYFKVLNRKDIDIDQIPLLLTTVDAHISGMMAEVSVTQYYKNSGSVPLEAQYVFPGSPDAAVYHLDMQVGDRVINAKVAAKAEAQKVYDEAKEAGKTASLLAQGDPGLFTMNVANILPGDDIRVTLKYTEKIVPVGGKYRFKYPAVGRPSVLAGGNTSPQSYAPGDDMGFDLSVTIEAPFAINAIESKNHELTETWQNDSQVMLLLDLNETLNFKEDFIIEYDLRAQNIDTGLLLYQDKEAGYFTLMMQPPAAFTPDAIVPREYILLVDSSGSMGYNDGAPIENAKFIASTLLSELTEQEYFNVVLFAGGSQILSPTSLQATEAHINSGLEMVDVSSAGGSTYLRGALQSINGIPRMEGVSRSLIVLTDGAIDVPQETIQLLRETPQQNVFVIGVSAGYSNDRASIDAIAEAGQGLSFYAENDEDIAELQEQFLDYVRYPLLSNIQINAIGFEGIDIFPKQINDLFAQKPLYLTGRYQGQQRGSIEVTGQGNGLAYRQFFDLDGLPHDNKNSAIKYLWAKEKINDLMFNETANREAITALGLSHNLLTEYTSFVAVDHVVRNDGTLEKVAKSPYSPSVSGFGFARDALKIELDFTRDHKQQWLVDALPTQTDLPAVDVASRRSITFIVGQDKSLNNLYYQAAQVVYGQPGAYQTDWVVDHLRDVAAIKRYLVEHRDPQAPWGLINIVSHSSPWSGLTHINEAGELNAMNVFSLSELISADEFNPLSDDVIDGFTEIRVMGCALGRQQHMLRALSVFFGGQDPARPVVKAPLRHVYMAQSPDLKTAQVYEYSVPWFISQNPQFDPQRSETHGIDAADWNALPIEIAFEIPDSSHVQAKYVSKLLAQQPLLTEFLSDMGVGVEDFAWQLEAGKQQSARLVGQSYLITTQLDRVNLQRIKPLDFSDPQMISVAQ